MPIITDEDGEERFLCYHCTPAYNDHESCVGASCCCSCPLPDEMEREAERQKVLDKLTTDERRILGF